MPTAEPELVELGAKIARASYVQEVGTGSMRNPSLVRHWEVLEVRRCDYDGACEAHQM